MKRSYLWAGGLSVIVLSAALFYQLRTTFLSVDTVSVGVSLKGVSERAKRMDEILIEHVRTPHEVKQFRHVLSAEERPLKVKAVIGDKCEVTQKDFQKFAQWARKRKDLENLTVKGQPLDWKYTSNTMTHVVSGKLNAAVTGVTYYDAHTYCRAAGGRLPTTDEWIAMAAGREGRLYPWGNEMREDAWPYLDPLLNATQKCGVHKKTTATAERLMQIGHGVSEWAHNPEDATRPSVHGGNAFNQPRALYALSGMYRYAPMRFRSPYLGFRCVYDRRVHRTPWKTQLRVARIRKKKDKGGWRTGMPEGGRVAPLMLNLPADKFHLVGELFESFSASNRTLRVMRTEVTRAQYRLFLSDPMVRFGFYANDNQPRNHDYHPDDWARQLLNPGLPVVGVDWWSAYAYALWSGGRLPKASEWSALASDFGRTIYPWGNQYAVGKAVTAESNLSGPLAAGASPADATASGVLDMGGNVSEWTRSAAITADGHGIVVKGGSYMLPGKETARMDFSNRIPPNHRAPGLGFRVVFEH